MDSLRKQTDKVLSNERYKTKFLESRLTTVNASPTARTVYKDTGCCGSGCNAGGCHGTTCQIVDCYECCCHDTCGGSVTHRSVKETYNERRGIGEEAEYVETLRKKLRDAEESSDKYKRKAKQLEKDLEEERRRRVEAEAALIDAKLANKELAGKVNRLEKTLAETNRQLEKALNSNSQLKSDIAQLQAGYGNDSLQNSRLVSLLNEEREAHELVAIS